MDSTSRVDFKKIFKDFPKDFPKTFIREIDSPEKLKALLEAEAKERNNQYNVEQDIRSLDLDEKVALIRETLKTSNLNKIKDVIRLYCGIQIQFYKPISHLLIDFLDTLDIIYNIKDKYIFIEDY